MARRLLVADPIAVFAFQQRDASTSAETNDAEASSLQLKPLDFPDPQLSLLCHASHRLEVYKDAYSRLQPSSSHIAPDWRVANTMTILGSVLTNESVESLSLLPQISSSEGDSYQQSSSCETTSASAIDDIPWSDFLIELDEIASPGHMSHCQEPLLDQAPEFSSDVPVSQQVTDALPRPEDQPCESAKDEEVVFVASHQVSHAESVRSPHMRNQIVKGHKRRSEGVSRVRKSTRTAAKRFRDQYDERWIGERYKSLVEKIQTIAESGEQRLQQIVVEQRDLRRLHLDLQETVLNLERHVEERLDGLEDSQCCDKGLTEVHGIRKTLLLQLDSLNGEMSQFKRRLEGIGISVL